ncbi:MAG: MBL fold metallo-hydrolase [Rhodospirillales bacterium]|nr:MBL fold metallo-hydrolase [Rhodospirillales bacterium]
MTRPIVEGFFDRTTSTLTYLVHAGAGTECVVIDPVLDFDLRSGRTGDSALRPVIEAIARQNLRLSFILETHVHADHVTGAQPLKTRVGGVHAIGRGVAAVGHHFGPLFDIEPGGFDRLLEDGECLSFGELSVEVIATPGHTPDSVSYRIGDALFVGDTIFMPDSGTARCDFPGGDARLLWRSIRRLLAHPPETRIFVCHDYQPGGRPLAFETSVGEERRANIHVRDEIGEDEFVSLRESRDKALPLPSLIIPSVQANLLAGRVPAFIKVPVDRL